MIGVLTKYNINGVDYGSYILGNDISTVKEIARSRGLNEEIESQIMEVHPIPDYMQLSDSDFINRLPEILHTVTFLSFIAVKANTISAEELLNDEGLIHELAHLLANIDGCHKKSLICIRDLLKHLQEKAIGCYEPV
ncbi:MAG: hypothetical protein Q8891_05440 [Bacteroidota bacterium]|nr:hypothetical protein [Bacteroidota bacterium]